MGYDAVRQEYWLALRRGRGLVGLVDRGDEAAFQRHALVLASALRKLAVGAPADMVLPGPESLLVALEPGAVPRYGCVSRVLAADRTFGATGFLSP